MNIYSLMKGYFIKKLQNQKDVDEYYTYISMNIFCLFAAIPHVFYAVYFFIFGIYPLFVLNIISCVIYVACYHMVKNSKYRPAIIISIIEIAISTMVTVFLIGPVTSIQWYLVVLVIAQFLVVKFWGWERIVIIFMLYICFLISSNTESFVQPIYVIENVQFLRTFNLNVVFIAIIIELTMDKFVDGITGSIQQRNIEELMEQAHIDPLTKLYNRRYAEIYFDSIRKNSARSANICMSMIDIDNFKIINDTYGHSNGDKVLIFLADVFKTSLRHTDLIFRWGGEEFLIVTTNLDMDTAIRITESIRKRVEESEIIIDDKVIKFTITAGVAELNGKSIEETIAECDNNLYIGKRSNKNKVVS